MGASMGRIASALTFCCDISAACADEILRCVFIMLLINPDILLCGKTTVLAYGKTDLGKGRFC